MDDDEQTTGWSGEPGSPARAESIRLSVPEMDCPSCATKVDTSLERLDGVLETALRPTTGTTTVTFDPDRVSRADIVRAIEGVGYAVVDGESASDPSTEAGFEIAPPSEVWTSPRAIKTWIGSVLLTPGLLFEFLLSGLNPVVAGVLGYPLTLADVLFLGAIAVSGYPVLRNGYYSARNRSLDIDLLMGTAIIAATGIGYYVEAATLAVLFSIAELLETFAMDRARDSLRELMELSPEEATVRRDGDTRTVEIDDVAVGETVIVRPGEEVPLDGVVIEGQSAVDESPITGESVPVEKEPGTPVYAGSINEAGYLEIEVTSLAENSTLSRIIQLVQGAQETQTETEQFVDRFAGYYTPVVVAFAILLAFVPPLVLGWPWRTWFIRGLTLLVIACPCAFVISTPVSVVSGITSAANNGVLIKGGNHLETMGASQAIALDKTGTLSKGELGVTDVLAVEEENETEVLRYAASLESRSEHPIADAILDRADAAGIATLASPSDFESLPGRGIRATIEGETYFVGKPALFEGLGFDLSRAPESTDGGQIPEGLAQEAGLDRPIGETLSELAREGKSVVMVGTESRLLGVIGIADEVRPEARAAVSRLQDLGLGSVVMLTGDNEGTARAIADQVGIDEFRAGLLPEDKVGVIESLQAEYGTVAMVGDGINDAPALATADVGVAMGAAGTDTAIETADIALMGDDLGKLPYLYELSNRANQVIRQNIWSSLGVKALLALGVPLGYVSVALAVVVGDMGMSLGVTGNAMRLSRVRATPLAGDEVSEKAISQSSPGGGES